MEAFIKEYLYKKVNDALDSLENQDVVNTLNILEELRVEIQDGIYD